VPEIHDILKKYWGHSNFRPLQEEIIKSVLDSQPTIALLPTGGGKSVCFQVPALSLEGICIVVSPLIALMKDQVHQLKSKGIKAQALFAGMSKREIDITLDNCVYGEVKFLYVSPERLKTELFLARSERMTVSMLAIDEAHCISQWGYDFRPPYLEIREFIDFLQIQKVIALTASATNTVTKDIAEKLGFINPKIFQKSFARLNLSYSVFETEQKETKLLDILKKVPGSSVVYVRSRKRTREVSDLLKSGKISANYYHAGLTTDERSKRQEAWINNKIRVIVATNAFGMGIDKPDVRTVIHMDLPNSLEAYYQEAGRAGRDERKAYAVALFDPSDVIELRKWVEKSIVEVDFIKRTYQALANFYKLAVGSAELTSFPFDYEAFVQNFNLPTLETFYALKKLEEEGLILQNESTRLKSKLLITQEQTELYKFQISHQNLDFTIKTLLRLYGGELFSNYLNIDEQSIAQITKRSNKEIRQHLKFLHDADIVDYQPVTGKPLITFLTPRYDSNNLPIDVARLKWRKKVALEKLASVEGYVTNKNTCRTEVIQNYFDELDTQSCGICDVCLRRKKDIKDLPIEPIKQELLKSPKNAEQLKQTLRAYLPETINEAIRILIDEDAIVSSQGLFMIKK